MSSPQLDEPGRSPERAALDLAVKALRKIDLLSAEMGYPDTLGFEDARERILGEIADAMRGIAAIVPGSTGRGVGNG